MSMASPQRGISFRRAYGIAKAIPRCGTIFLQLVKPWPSPFLLERSSRMAGDGASPVSTRVCPQLVDFAARQIRQDRRFDYHVTRTRDANLEVLCVCSNVLLPS